MQGIDQLKITTPTRKICKVMQLALKASTAPVRLHDSRAKPPFSDLYRKSRADTCVDWNQRKSEFSTSLQHHLVCNADFFSVCASAPVSNSTDTCLMLSINTISLIARTSGQAGAATPQSWRFNTTSPTRSPFTLKHVQMSQLHLSASAMGKAMHFPSTSNLRQSRTMQHTRPMTQDAKGKQPSTRKLARCCFVHQRSTSDVNPTRVNLQICFVCSFSCPAQDLTISNTTLFTKQGFNGLSHIFPPNQLQRVQQRREMLFQTYNANFLLPNMTQIYKHQCHTKTKQKS